MSSPCQCFQAHQLLPDKCRICFAEKSKHQSHNPANDKEPSAMESDKETIGCLKSEIERLKSSGALERSKYEAEIERLNRELNSIVKDHPSQNDDDDDDGKDNCKKCQHEIAKLRQDLEESREKCRSLGAERDQAREETKNLEREMDEMHDNFGEDESEQFEQVKQELDIALKNCKILQIRLNKAERQYSQLEQVKSLIERQLEEATSLQQQHNDNRKGNDTSVDQSLGATRFNQMGSDTVRLSTTDYDQLIRDLSDICEREKDLQEQLKYSQEEAQLKGDRLQAIETENEVLLSRINKLTLANSRLRSRASCESPSQSIDRDQMNEPPPTTQARSGSNENCSNSNNMADLIVQNEQIQLALDVARAECNRLQSRFDEQRKILETKESQLVESQRAKRALEERLATCGGDHGDQAAGQLELECRRLRTRLINSERGARQLKAQLEVLQARAASSGGRVAKQSSQEGDGLAELRETNQVLREQLDAKTAQLRQLVQQMKQLEQNRGSARQSAEGATDMESDLLEKLKRQLAANEEELARSRARLVELDLECSRSQRAYKRLVESLETKVSSGETKEGEPSSTGVGTRRLRLPAESARDSMSRGELRAALREAETALDASASLVRAKECLLRERASGTDKGAPSSGSSSSSATEEQLRSAHRLLDQERLLSANLKLDVGRLEGRAMELERARSVIERERKAMEEELDKLRQLTGELRADLEEARRGERAAAARARELHLSHEKLRAEMERRLAKVGQTGAKSSLVSATTTSGQQQQAPSAEMLLMARDLSELKVKNGFLIRELEMAREEATRRQEEQRRLGEERERRSVELATIELRERQLAESQQLRDELADCKQKLATGQRALARADEELAGERDKLRSLERDARREKSSWQQRLDQAASQAAIERRSSEFRLKEVEGQVREKERETIGLQERYVQLERDLKRLQNKHKALEESAESKEKSLARQLEAKKEELAATLVAKERLEEEFYEKNKRIHSERATLGEAFESLKRSFHEKLVELKSTRELLLLRQDQAYKERLASQERQEQLHQQLVKATEHEARNKLLRNQLEQLERQLEWGRRETNSLKDDRSRLRKRCEEMERRCSAYEKHELAAKTSTISVGSSGGLFGLRRGTLAASPGKAAASTVASQESALVSASKRLVVTQSTGQFNQPEVGGAADLDRLSGKINDQRQMIDLLRQQLSEAQGELRQVRLSHAADKNRWQIEQAQLTGRVNECEERILFESSLELPAETFDQAKRRLDNQVTGERRLAQETIRQLQSQMETLIRDLKRLGQAHELLKLHSKQLESHNNKLSKKLIEYQTSQATGQTGSTRLSVGKMVNNDQQVSSLEKRQLIERLGELENDNRRLIRVLECEAKPLVEIVTKMLNSMDSSQQPASQNDTTVTRSSVTSSGVGLSRHRASSSDDARYSRSTARPLNITPPPAGGTRNGNSHKLTSSNLSHDDADEDDNGSLDSADRISTARPAHQMAGEQSSRLQRIFGRSKTPIREAPKVSLASGETPKGASNGRSVRRVRVKSLALGISTGERRDLRRHLAEVASLLGKGPQMPSSDNNYNNNKLTSSGLDSAGPSSISSDHSILRVPPAQSKSQSRAQSTGRVVHWQSGPTDWDSDSQRSWCSTSGLASRSSSVDQYRRFPQATPSRTSGLVTTTKPGGHQSVVSLTDCDSDVSLTSDYSGAYDMRLHSRARLASGAESDSCLQAATKVTGKRRGLKIRLTSTLRNISRSITGFASDSESELGQVNKARPPGQHERASSESKTLKEIRV